jgi:hypothetical protein
MYKTINSTRIGWNRMLCLLLVLLGNLAQAQQASWGNTMVHSGGSMAVFGVHDFQTGLGTQPGIIKTERSAPVGIFRFADGASYINEGPGKHIDGYVSKTGTSEFTFPVGDGTKLRPVKISAPVAIGTFRAAYFSTNPNTATLPTGAPFPVANLGTGVSGVSAVEYWDLDGPSAVNVTLTWDAASNLNTLTGSAIANLIIVGYNPATSKWENLGNAGGTTGTLASTGSITANGVTPDTYSAITFGVAQVLTTPDLRPFIIMAATGFTSATTTRSFSVRVRNMRDATTATDPVIVRILKPTLTSTITLTGTSATEWSVTATTPAYYQLTTNSDIASGAIGNVITANLTIPASAATGAFNFAVAIPDLSGGEVLSDNGNNSTSIQVFKN